MSQAFVVLPGDVPALLSHFRRKLKDQTIVCSFYAELPSLARAECVFFVVAETSKCSTAFQQLVLDGLPQVEESRRRLFRLDHVSIPVGFEALQRLPEDLATFG